MSDPQNPANPNDAQPANQEGLQSGKPGVKDKGKLVSTAGGEPLSGHIADLADGDD